MDPEQAYRGVVARCPACASPMEVRAAGDAEIDVCPTCRGMWLDWFDGDTVSLVELAMPLSRRPSAPMLAEPRCPRCERNLASDAHATSDTSVWRCGECAGTFLPRATAEALLIWAASNEAPASVQHPRADAARQATLLDRLRRALRTLFAGTQPTS